jgi:predicted nucleic acid-binding protein
VVQEFMNVSLKKFKPALITADLAKYLEEVLFPLCSVFPSEDFYRQTLRTREQAGFSFYDSMIVQAAVAAGCRVLYSEDFQDGFKFAGLTVKNPFN